MTTPKLQKTKLAIIGSGPAGLTAAIYASRAKLEPLIIAGNQPGGQLMITTDVDDFPGFPEGIQGPDLMSQMTKQAERFGTKLIRDNVKEVNFSDHPFFLTLDSRLLIQAEAVIIATGASARWLGLDNEKRLTGRGVSACAVCDAPFFKEKPVVVIGGGDTALREALHLTKFASSVTVVHRRDKLRAMKELQDRAFKNEKIKWVWNTQVLDILGEAKVEGIKINREDKEETLVTDAVFVAIGHQPNTSFLRGQVDIGEKGYVLVTDGTKTSVPGVFVAGDVSDWKYRQAVTAAGEGSKAALEAEAYLDELEVKQPATTNVSV